MPEPPDFERKRAELERRRATIHAHRLAATVALLPAEAQERIRLVIDACLVADADELARLHAAGAGPSPDFERLEAIAAEVLARYSPEELQAKIETAHARHDPPDASPARLTPHLTLTVDGRPFPAAWCDTCEGVRPVLVGLLGLVAVEDRERVAAEIVCTVCYSVLLTFHEKA